MGTKLRLVLSTTILFFSFYGVAQTSYWKREKLDDNLSSRSLDRLEVRKAHTYSLSPEYFNEELVALAEGRVRTAVIYFPDAKGELIPFEVTETPVLSESLRARYPNIRSYSGQSKTHPEDRIRFSLSHKGIQSMLVKGGGQRNTFMQKIDGSNNQYVLYQREELGDELSDFQCFTGSLSDKEINSSNYKLVDDQLLRKYRLAVSATGEYTQFHGGTVADALAAINATITRVNEVFETDLGISLELVANNDSIIFTDAANDPYGTNLNMEVQNTLSTNIGEVNYDIGHLFHEDNNAGNAGFIGSVCKDNQKGSAFSSALNPQGDVFDLDFVAHEMGHQFGANHTWSFESEGTQVQAEPASGSTIMGYAGIVDGNNVQPNGDDYFHYFSILQITDYLQTVSCGQEMAISNNPPVINPLNDFIIPKGTPFVLTADATDPDAGDVLTYAWEQVDDGVVTTSSFGPDNATGANFRSRRPLASPSRYFPRLEEIVQGNLTQTNPAISSAWETVSEVERDLNFALTVRDNAMGGGQVASDLVNIRVLNSAGPFMVNSQATGEIYEAGSVIMASWEVAGTDKGLINAQLVDIFLSEDGGLSYPFQLADGVPNDGSHEVLLPGIATTTARIMVKASNNIFFAINQADFTITESPFVLQFEKLLYGVCSPDSLLIPFSYESFGGFSEEVVFSIDDAPPGLGIAFSPDTVITDTVPVNLSITNTDLVTGGTYLMTVTATSLTQTRQVPFQLQLFDATFSQIPLLAPADGAIDVSLNLLLDWTGFPAYTSYDIEIATDAAFNTIIESANVIFTEYAPTQLLPDTTYYWRVKPKNSCGEGTFSTPFSFSTISISCQGRSASSLPLAISSIGTPTVEATISFLDDLPVADIDVTLQIDHTFLGDLVISLISPSGTQVVLTANSCGEFSDIDAVFDDDGSPIVCGNSPAIGGTVQPLGSLASFNGEPAIGDWTLRIADTAPADGGMLNAFDLQICVEGDFRPDDDDDGVFDDGDDQCLGTPKGAEVGPDGCQIFRFDPMNFSVAIESESCIPNNDGVIEIVAVEEMDYSVTVSGPGVSLTEAFTTNYQLGSLSSGTYSLCINGTDGSNTFEPYCFDVVIQQPDSLSVLTAISPNGQQANLELGGAELYFVELNGVTRQVTAPEITLDLIKGENSLKVSTLLPCQGTYSEELFIPGQAVVYPNPVVDELKIYVGSGQEQVYVSVFAMGSRFMERKSYAPSAGEIVIDFSTKPTGLYLLRVEGTTIRSTYKVVKR